MDGKLAQRASAKLLSSLGQGALILARARLGTAYPREALPALKGIGRHLAPNLIRLLRAAMPAMPAGPPRLWQAPLVRSDGTGVAGLPNHTRFTVRIPLPANGV